MDHTRFVGFDVHKERISIAVAESGRSGTVEYLGEIDNDPGAIRKLCERLRRPGKPLAFCYEAGPCGYGVYRQLTELGHRCEVVAPSLIPMKPGDRVKTDRRDATLLARLHRAGELTSVGCLTPITRPCATWSGCAASSDRSSPERVNIFKASCCATAASTGVGQLGVLPIGGGCRRWLLTMPLSRSRSRITSTRSPTPSGACTGSRHRL